jgi:hypothetical protein
VSKQLQTKFIDQNMAWISWLAAFQKTKISFIPFTNYLVFLSITEISCIVLNYWMINKWGSAKTMKGSGSQCNLRYYPNICQERPRKIINPRPGYPISSQMLCHETNVRCQSQMCWKLISFRRIKLLALPWDSTLRYSSHSFFSSESPPQLNFRRYWIGLTENCICKVCFHLHKGNKCRRSEFRITQIWHSDMKAL